MGFTLKFLFRSMLTPSITNGDTTFLFSFFVLEIYSNMENPIVSNKYKIVDMDETIIVIFAIYSTYLF